MGRMVSARHMRQLAEAINARILSGLGDAAWRYVFWWVSVARQIRNPDASGNLFPAATEFHKFYQHIRTSQDFPDTGPGDPEGINLASIIGAYVYGNDTAGIDAEDIRLTDPEAGGVPLEDAKTPEEYWELAKAQRGAYDPGTGAMGAPAWQAALTHYSLVQSPTSPHGNSYGGFFPSPEYLEDCLDGVDGAVSSLSYQIFFTNISTGATRVYPGTCPAEPSHVARVVRWPLGYYVVLNSGAVEFLPLTQWIEGPYTAGGTLAKAPGGHMPRILNRFVGEFRGDATRHQAELEGNAPVHGQAFDVRKFFLRQYMLSPAYGKELGEDLVVADYPRRMLTGSTSAASGTRIGQPIQTHEGFVVAAFFVFGGGFRRETLVELRQGDTVLGTARVSSGTPSAIVVLPRAVSGEVTFVLPEGARFQAGGGLRCEVAELYEYMPQAHDLMLVCRLGGARANIIGGTDGSGLDADDAREIWTTYSETGCILERREDQYLDGSINSINQNAVYDMMKRWSKTARIIPRSQVVAYAVEDGKSVIWMSPHPLGMAGSERPDSLEGIRDAIAQRAPPKGWSNRWCLYAEFSRYANAGTSIWAPEKLADWVAKTDRCAHWTPIIPILDIQLQRHFSFGSATAARSYTPEVASGYRYAKNLNQSATEPFYRSCQIYVPPIEVESAVTEEVDGQTLVKVTLTGRLHHHHSLAPVALDREISTWVTADLTAEAADYRTTENAIREYLVHIGTGTYQCESTGPGNAAANSDILFGSDVPWGACFPNLYLVQLMPEPYLDGNTRREDNDTCMTHEQMSQAELWVRIMSEGCVDGQTSADYGCATGVYTVFDYRFENLCYQVLGVPWLTTMPTETTARLSESQIRADHPMGFGPLPTTLTTAESFNQLAKLVNALTDYRVMLPVKFEARTEEGQRLFTVTDVMTANGDVVDCPGTGQGFVWRGNAGDVTSLAETMAWTEVAAASSSYDAGFAATTGYTCAGAAWTLAVTRVNQEYRFEFTDASAIYAIPSAWREQLATSGQLLAIKETRVETVTAVMASSAPTECNGSTVWQVGGVPMEWRISETLTSECGIFPATAMLVTPPAGRIAIIGFTDTPICNELAASSANTSVGLTPVTLNVLVMRVPLEDPDPTT